MKTHKPFIVFFLLLIIQCSYAVSSGVTTPKVVSLAWSSTHLLSEASFTCSAVGPAFPSGSTVTYTWSGTGVTFVAPTNSSSVTAYVYEPGTYTISCAIHIVYPSPPGTIVDWSGSSTTRAIGGPITINSDRSSSDPDREGRTGLSVRYQPWILEDYSGGSQTQTNLSLVAKGGQPGTCTYTWSKSGTLKFPSGTTGQVTNCTADGSCGRGGSCPIVTYSVTINGTVYTATDSTDPQYKAVSCHRPSDCRFYESDNDPDTVVVGPPSWTYIKHYHLYIVSNIGDPLTLTEFQERYPGPIYWYRGSSYSGTSPNLGIPDGVQWNGNQTPVPHWTSGPNPNLDPSPGYTYNSKSVDADSVGASGWPADFNPGFVLYQSIYAATTSTVPGAPGISVHTFTLNVWPTGVERL